MRRRAGAVLLEAIVALAIAAVAGVALLDVATESTRAVRRARLRDRDVMSAGRLLATASLWSAGELDQRLGLRRQGRWLLSTQRIAPSLYSLAVLDSAGNTVMLETTMFRPATQGP